jgi:DNA repair exonuclease SbcCD ATPase subunit
METKEKYVKIRRLNPDKPIVVYSGSMIQQNHGEKPFGHGYVLWNTENRSPTHHEVHNDYGYYTVTVRDGRCVSNLDLLPNKARLRVKVYNTTAAETKVIIADIRKKTSITDLNVTRCDAISEAKKFDRDNRFNFGDVSQTTVQNELIEDYLSRNFVVTDDQMKGILEINKEINGKLGVKEVLRNCIWKPKKFEFGNMFSYGEGNVVDFSNMKSVMGLFASNASGKSSVMSALSFCLFDKCDRAFKASHILNTIADTFRCKLNFEISGTDYYIERNATTKKNGDVTVSVDFWRVNEHGDSVSLNGEMRAGTNALIRDHVGSYDDFILTTLSLQNNNAIFIDKSQSERKDLLAQFMGIDIFDRLHSEASEDIKEVNALLKRFNKEDFSEILANNKQNLSDKQDEYDAQQKKTEAHLAKQRNLNETLVKLNADYKTCSVEEQDLDIDDLEFEKKNLQERLEKANETRDATSQEKQNFVTKKNLLKETIANHENDAVESEHLRILEIGDKMIVVDKDLAVLRTSVNAKLDKLKHFENHEYDPKCDYCTKNAENLIENTKETKSALATDKKEASKLVDKKNDYLKEIGDSAEVEKNYKVLIDSRSNLKSIVYEINDKDSKVLALSSMIESLEKDVLANVNRIALYHECRDSIVFNKELRKEVLVVKNELSSVDSTVEKETERSQTLFGELKILEKEEDDILNSIEEAKEFEKKKRGYELYLDAVKRDGISYELISQTMPSIESEVNNILSQIVDFTMQLEMDGKHIYSKIVYEDRHWPLEMCSGMERFISSIAMRVALINVSSLPRSNFLAIDEGWGSLDGDNISSVFNLFTYLKGQFEFILVISHLDIMRDMVDEIIEIQPNAGFSKIKYGV